MTTTELIAILQTYPADTPVFIGRGYDLHAHQVTPDTFDDWEHSTKDDDGETPAVGQAVHIGPRF